MFVLKIQDCLRSCFRFPLFVASIFWYYSIFLLKGKKRGEELSVRWAQCVLKILGMRVHCLTAVPKDAQFLVSNHLSYLDIPVLWSLGSMIFVAKQDVASWPWLGRISQNLGTIFICRENKKHILEVNQKIAQALLEGKKIVVFPEGTSSNGEQVLPFRSNLLSEVVKEQDVIGYACVQYRTGNRRYPARTAVCWWGDAGFMSHFLRFLMVPSTDVYLAFGTTKISGGDRKLLAKELWQNVDSLRMMIEDLDQNKGLMTTDVNP